MPQKKWNLQDIKPAGQPRKTAPNRSTQPVRETQSTGAPRMQRMDVAHKAPTDEPIDEDIASIHVVDGRSARTKRTVTAIILTAIFVVLAVVVNMMLSGAEVSIEPRTKEISVQSIFTAHLSPQTDDLGYELLTLESEAETQIEAEGIEQVANHSTGKVFVYNTANPSPQRLITNTRFESPDGLIFRIKDSIEVPGITKDADGNVVPGKIVAEVFADGPGEQYNLEPSRFTVPGLKGTPQYDNIYAESTTGFEEGFEGERYIIEDAQLQVAQQELQTKLRNDLLQQIADNVPNGFVMYPDSVNFVFESLPATEYGESLATIKERARMHVPLFLEREFATYIAELSIPDYTGEEVYLENPNTLIFAYEDETMAQKNISEMDSLEFTLKGITKLIWEFDPQQLQSDLAGIKDSETPQVFAKYPAIDQATTELRPFWVSSFPDNPDDIVILSTVEN